jgi:P-type Ca2+ transporter type 2C
MASAQSKLVVNEITKNRFVWFAILICVAQMVFVFTVSQLRAVLGLNMISTDMWIVAMFASLIPLLLVQIFKIIFTEKMKK